MKIKTKKASEKLVWQWLKDGMRKTGGWVIKIDSPSVSGFPDALILSPNGKVGFAETKTTGKPLDPLQVVWKRILTSFGVVYFKLDSKADVQDCLNYFNITD